jgi:phospholipase C
MRHYFQGFVVAVLSAWFAPLAIAATPASIQQATPTATPIKYLIVIFDENISFDHYFGTYPNAANPPGEPPFYPRPNTPSVNGFNRTILQKNPNGIAPFRLDRSQDMTCDNINYYTQEQKAYHGGLMDMFSLLSAPGSGCLQNLNFGYYDGNTVTALWNYAQYFTLEDNFFASTFGTTVMGHLNLLAGQTHGATPPNIAGKVVNGSVISNIDPTDDDCSSGSTIVMSGPTVGDLLNAKALPGDGSMATGRRSESAMARRFAVPTTTPTTLPFSTTHPPPTRITFRPRVSAGSDRPTAPIISTTSAISGLP